MDSSVPLMHCDPGDWISDPITPKERTDSLVNSEFFWSFVNRLSHGDLSPTRVHSLWLSQRSSAWPFIFRGNYWLVTRAFGVYSGMHIFTLHIEYCILADNGYFNIIHLRPHLSQ